jgi:hypothetical protein
MIYEHEVVMIMRPAGENTLTPVHAPRLSEVKEACTANGNPAAFTDYLNLENRLWKKHDRELASIDADHTFRGDGEEPAEYKRFLEKCRVACEFRENIFFQREQLLQSVRETADGDTAQ